MLPDRRRAPRRRVARRSPSCTSSQNTGARHGAAGERSAAADGLMSRGPRATNSRPRAATARAPPCPQHTAWPTHASRRMPAPPDGAEHGRPLRHGRGRHNSVGVVGRRGGQFHRPSCRAARRTARRTPDGETRPVITQRDGGRYHDRSLGNTREVRHTTHACATRCCAPRCGLDDASSRRHVASYTSSITSWPSAAMRLH